MSKPTRVRTGVCQECGSEFVAGSRGKIASRCPDCRAPKVRVCPTCGDDLPLVWRGGPRPSWFVSGLYCSDRCKPRCSIDGCDRPRRKRGWCANHYTTWRVHGDPERVPAYSWGVRTVCKVCSLPGDDPRWTQKSRDFCSNNCTQLWRKHKGNVPTSINCAVCGDVVSLLEPTKVRARRRSDTAYCIRHGKRPTRGWCVSVNDLALRDGAWCRLCGFMVDMTLPHPDPMCPTVDHIMPRSLGGLDVPDNCQLAHKSCNSSKRSRYDG